MELTLHTSSAPAQPANNEDSSIESSEFAWHPSTSPLLLVDYDQLVIRSESRVVLVVILEGPADRAWL